MSLPRFQCGVCGHIYDPQQGEPSQGIPPGKPFDELPADWHCPVCDSPKSAFSEIQGK